MFPRKLQASSLARRGAVLAAMLAATALAFAHEPGHPSGRATYILTSTNDASHNAVVAFELHPGTRSGANASLSLAYTLPTGGKGGASGNAGILQFQDGPDLGAVANYGSSTVSRFVRRGNAFAIAGTIPLASGCQGPDSVALSGSHLFVAGLNCAESYAWPYGNPEGSVVSLPDNSAGQIAVGQTWAAVTMKSGTVLALPLTREGGVLTGAGTAITLPENANDTPLGAAFWGDLLGFNPAHSPDSLALINTDQKVFPIAGPAPSYPSNAPCWIVKGPGNAWYTGNSPGMAVSIFFTDAQGGSFYKSVPVPGVPTDITISPDQQWLAVIYTAADGAHVAVFSIDSYGGLTQQALSPAIGVSAFSGVAISQ